MSAVDTKPAVTVETLVLESQLFDEAYYRAQGGHGANRAKAIEDYLTRGESLGLAPSREFEPSFYLAAYPDVAAAKLNALGHFLEHGCRERRYPSLGALAVDARRIVDAQQFDISHYLRIEDKDIALDLSDVEHYLLIGGFQGAWPNPDFDSLFYRGAYADVGATRENPLVHYLRIGRTEGRFTNDVALNAAVETIKKGFDQAHYRRQGAMRAEDATTDPVRHYLLTGVLGGFDPAPDFNRDYYLRRYPDIARIGIEPYSHYLQYGRNEGRAGRADFKRFYRAGDVEFDRSKPTLLIASHEGSRTGAPLVGLALADAFAETHNVVSFLGRDRGLTDPFATSSVLLVVAEGEFSPVDAEFLLRDLMKQFKVSALLANSVETYSLVKAALHVDLPSVALVHEFAEYSLPRGKVSDVVAAADIAVAPAVIVVKSAQKELRSYYGGHANNLVVRPQGRFRLDNDREETDLSVSEIRSALKARTANPKIVLGAGYVQVRKGVDLFVETARHLVEVEGEEVHFVWVGDGYDPDHDLALSIWVRELLDKTGLKDRVHFFPAQSKLDDFFEAADVFYLPSRLDPYPNVGVDAMFEGAPIVCFEGATGIAEAIERGEVLGSSVAYGDASAAAAAIARHLSQTKAEGTAHNALFVNEQLDFAGYATFLAGKLLEAKALRAEVIAARGIVAAADVFDARFHLGFPNPIGDEGSFNPFIAASFKGLTSSNPRPGFSNGLWRAQHPDAPARVVPLAAALSAGQSPPITHDCRTLRGKSARRRLEKGVALHVHMHYPELVPSVLDRLNKVKVPMDLFITTTSPEKRQRIEVDFLKYRGGSVRVLEGPNLGRDIGPFMTSVGEHVMTGGYDLVGHFHGKKSLAVGGTVGDRWRSYLMDILLGAHGELAEIITMFADEPDLGLVFAEDRHAISWSDNRELAEALADRLTPRPKLPEFPVFPIGNMFWARPAAVAPLWSAGFGFSDYPPEPVPIDGTILHAVERMLPAICEATGHRWRTVFKDGAGW